MSLTVYNTLSRRKEPFETLEPGKVRMYYCGVTVYDYCHLGHARACITWDVVRRYLSWRGYEVRYVQNFTDIDDKILNRARQENSTMEVVSDRYIQAYFEDMTRLNVMEADEYPRATHTIDGIKRLVHELEQKSFAYASQGDVYYAVRQFADYGKLSGRNLDDRSAGRSGRVEGDDPEAQKKRDPFDFALWKAAKPGEPAWESPWGAGRPGWHIECSAMVRDRLGETIDIHAGGNDLVFPHHENEIAQSEAATGQPLSRYWMHNGMVTVNGEKMSKSLGNFTTIRDLLDREQADPMAIRMFVLQASYRRPLDFTDDAIASAHKGWETLKFGLSFGYEHGQRLGWNLQVEQLSTEDLLPEMVEQFQAAMDDDFNTSVALAVLFETAKELRRQSNILVHEGEAGLDSRATERQWQSLVSLSKVLGLEADISFGSTTSGGLEYGNSFGLAITDAEIETKIQERQAARQGKNWAESDRIRDELQAQGITLIDQAGGTTRWHRS